MKIVIIGASFAGLSAAIKSAQLYPESQVIVIDRHETLAYIPNSLNWALRSDQATWNYSFFSREQLDQAGVQLLLNQEVVRVDPTQKVVFFSNGHTQAYDKLILAAGSTQQSSYIKGSNLPGVLMSKDYANSLEAEAVLKKAKRIAIIGAGQIGIEASETYIRMGKEVHLFEANPSLDFKLYDSDILEPLENSMRASGVQIHCQERVQQIISNSKGLQVMSRGQVVHVDAIMLCAGFRPNTTFLEDLPILAADKTVRVNSYLQTSLPHIFAAGDMVQLPLLEDKDFSYMPLINTALKTGELAAYNLFQPKVALPLSVRLVAGHQFGWYRSAIGLTAEEAGLYENIRVVDYKSPCSLRDPSLLFIRLVVTADTGRILGAQTLAKRDCSTLLQALVYPMAEQKTDRDLAFQDFLYTAGEQELFFHLHEVLLKSLDQRGELWK
ncbi:NAD(P)/FAD-dependent oxidoreductase [Streptococcus caprae]|uniref:FAD/NAD(P)-binding oxidoreductase n=1 Tax=Streptococcus caprae TaxID=1640501 RepID=A0ABV8CU12_9STRE